MLILNISSMVYGTASALRSLERQGKNTPSNWRRKDPCGGRWEGIFYNDSRVIKIILPGTNLARSLPENIISLSELQILDDVPGFEGVLDSTSYSPDDICSFQSQGRCSRFEGVLDSTSYSPDDICSFQSQGRCFRVRGSPRLNLGQLEGAGLWLLQSTRKGLGLGGEGDQNGDRVSMVIVKEPIGAIHSKKSRD
ncbi:unnamed protein product [Amaranthus hypochondriacus]